MNDESRVSWSERRRVKNDIRSALNSAERKLLIDLPKQLSEAMGLANTQALGQHVSNWIKHGWCTALVDYLCTAIYEKKIEQLSRFGNNLKRLDFKLSNDDDTELNECNSDCKWVPAAFSRLDGRRAYGGVFLRPKLSSQNNKGFQGFQASTKKSSSSANSSRGGFSGSSKGGSSGASRGGSSGSGGGSPPPPKPPTKREEIMKKYGEGKGWPETPIKMKVDKGVYTYFGKPGTCKSFYKY